MSKPSTTIYQ